ncbi:EAL domain-containing protein [Paenibacillus validus]|uniref:EAL domain-containing protein n=1 Tax=Paenibacillus validus TaxID=44253 RepID=UPI003D29A16E
MFYFLLSLSLFLTPVFILFYMAVETLQRNKRDRLNQCASLFFFSAMLMLFGNFMTSLFTVPFSGKISYLFIYLPAFAAMCLLIRFCALLSERDRAMSRPLLLILCYAPLLSGLSTLLFPQWSYIEIAEIGGWRYHEVSPLLMGVTVVTAVYTMGLSLYLVGAGLREAAALQLKLKRKQLQMVMWGVGLGGAWAVLLASHKRFSIVPDDLWMPDLSMFGVLIYAFFMRYAMMKYDFLLSIERKILCEMSPVSILIVDRNGIIRETNAQTEAMLGPLHQEPAMRRLDEWLTPCEEDAAKPAEDSRREALYRGEYAVHNRQGDIRFVRADSEFIYTAGERFQCVALLDITETKLAEAKNRHLAYHDTLTDLPNRFMFQQRLQESLSAVKHHQGSIAVILIGLDGFKKVNDSQGHHVGDLLLQHVADILLKRAALDATVFRLGGDEFAMIVPHSESQASIYELCHDIFEGFQAPFLYKDKSYYISASVGVSLFPEHGQQAEQLLQFADLAMYHAKQSGRNRYVLYDPFIHREEQERFRMDGWIRKGLKQGEFALHYQPQVDMESGRVTGAEALIRWHHPEEGLIPPNEFIPLAEESGTIVDIGYWVLDTACEQLRKWMEAGYAPLCISINLSAKQFLDPKFPDVLADTLNRTGIEPSLLCLEITERTAMLDKGGCADICREIMSFGVKLSIDDFGTGYSSLVLLKQLPVHSIKIDRSFVIELETNDSDRAIIIAMIAMSHNLGKKVVAEGVEELGQWNMLARLGCDEVQGYFASRPLPADEFVRFLARERQQGISVMSPAYHMHK